MTTENATDRLKALEGMTTDLDAANPSAEVQQAEAAEEKKAAAINEAASAWGMIPYSIGGTLCILAPELRQVYTQDACYGWGESAAKVAEKYGWNSPEGLPELALATATLGFVLPSYLIVREKMQDMREGKATGVLAKIGAWWRLRKAAKAAKAAQQSQAGAVPEAAQGAAA